MSNSKLVDYTKISRHKDSPRKHKIDSIVIHHMAAALSVEQCGNCFQGSRAASTNYGVGTDGRIGLYVDEKDRPYATASGGVDNRAVSIEVATYNKGGKWIPSKKTYTSLIKLVADICRRNNIRKLKWKNSKALGTSFQVSKQNMFLHKWFVNTACPGPYLSAHMGDIANSVNKLLKGAKFVDDGMPEGTDSSDGMLDEADSADVDDSSDGGGGLEVNWEAINPYILTIGREDNPKKFKCEEWKENKVIGVMLEAGYYFNKNHTVAKLFRNQNLYDQCLKVIENNIEFGYFFNGRAKSVAEVDKEMYELSFLVRKYPPGMGVWIVADFLKKVTKPKEEKAKIKFNDTILKEYEKELIRLGLTGKLGIYCKRDALEWFSWEDFQERWWLWLNDPVKETSELDELLDPKFFDTDNQSGELPAPPSGGFSFSSGGYEEDIVGTGEVAEKACQWAEKIAADNSFAYGKASGHWYHGRDRAHQLGCYFCGTTIHGPKRAKKGSRWEKTYCCNPFICAAYVHGGHIRKKCWKNGMSTESWTKRGFKFIGTNVPRSKLKRGDVILTQGHVKMYVGNGKQVEAAHSGWGSDSIRVCKLKLQVKPYRIVRYKDKKSASTSISSSKKSGAVDVVAHAKMRAKTKNKGLRYGNSWGSSSWDGPIMCHGFTRRIFLECGYKEVARRIKAGGFHLHPDSKKNLGVYKTIRATGSRLLESQLEPGDIVCSRFRYNNKKGYAWHSAIYLGDGKVAHSNNGKAYGRTGPKISNFNRTGFNKFLIAFRVIE